MVYFCRPIEFSRGGSEISALIDDFRNGIALPDPGKDIDFVPFDCFGSQQYIISDSARNAQHAVDITGNDVTGPDGYFSDFHRHLIMSDHAAPERTVAGTVFIYSIRMKT